MSNRANYFRYGGTPSTENLGFGEIFPLLSVLFGKDKITGGFQQGPDGKQTYTPYQGSSGFLGRGSRNQAMEMDNAIQQALFLNQLQQQAEMEREKYRGENEFYLQNQRDISAAERQEMSDKAETNRQRVGAIDTFTAKSGLVPNDANAEALDAATRNNALKIAEMMQALERDTLYDAGTFPAYKRGRQAQMEEQAFKNLNLGTIPLRTDEAVMFPEIPGLNLSTRMGPTTEQVITPNPSGFGDPTITKRVNPPIGMRVPLKGMPATQNQVPATTNPAYINLTPEQIAQQMQELRRLGLFQ